MSILFPYSVIDLDPSFQKVHTNYQDIHWKGLAGQTGLSGSMGYFFYLLKTKANQTSKRVFPYHFAAAAVGFGIGFYNNHYTITNQFQGYFPNDHLLQKYGPLNDAQIIEGLKKEGANTLPIQHFPNPFDRNSNKELQKYPMISLFPSSDQIIFNFEKLDYARMVGCGLLFLVNGVLITKFMKGYRRTISMDSMARETLYSLLFLQGIFVGISTEYNASHLRLLGLAPNEIEIQKYGKLNEINLLKEIFINKYPLADFEKINFQEVLLDLSTIETIQLALIAKYPSTDLSNIHFDKLVLHSSKQNQTVVNAIITAGYPEPTFLSNVVP